LNKVRVFAGIQSAQNLKRLVLFILWSGVHWSYNMSRW